MDIDTLIFILVFLAVVISNIKKIISESRKKKDAQKPEQSEKADFLQKAVKKFLSRIQEDIAPQSRETRSSGVESDRLSGWGAIMDEDHPLAASYEDQDEREEEEDYVPLDLDEAEPEIAPDISAPPEPLPEKVIEPEIESEPEEKRERSPAYSLKELQKAVVWSEILAPPLGLREE